jgi:ornithine cyclodeaminase/alanine dehydrogenase-like protein (mu-crystallin family)
MTLLIDNDVVKQVLTMADCIRVQEEAFTDLVTGDAVHRPRIDVYVPCDREDGYYRWGSMEGASKTLGIFAIRVKSDIVYWPRDARGGWTEEKYCVKPGTFCGLVFLFSTRSAEPLAIVNDGHLQHMRVGGGAGLGVKYLAREDAHTVGMLGSGGMARVYLQAFSTVRTITRVKVYSPTPANRRRFAEDMSRELQIPVEPVESPEAALRGMDIVASCTDSMRPTIRGEWLEPGMHVANLGPAEIGEDAYRRFDVKIRQGVSGWSPGHALERVEMERGLSPVAYIAGRDDEVARLPKRDPALRGFGGDFPHFTDLITGKAKGRTGDREVTFYHNIGNQGLQFAAVGGWVYQQARALGLGRELPTEWFLQDIRD